MKETKSPLVALLRLSQKKGGWQWKPVWRGLGFVSTSIDHVRAQAITLCPAIDKQYETGLERLEK